MDFPSDNNSAVCKVHITHSYIDAVIYPPLIIRLVLSTLFPTVVYHWLAHMLPTPAILSNMAVCKGCS